MSWVFSILTAIPGLAKQWFEWQSKKIDAQLEGFKTAAGFDLAAYTAWLSASVEITKAKLAAMGWWGAKLIILTAGLPASIHMAAVFLDSMPFPGHAVGQWGVPKPPAPYDAYQRDIVLSFFIIMPAMPLVNAVAQWLGRKK